MLINKYDKIMEYFKSFTKKKNVLILAPGPSLQDLDNLISKIDLDDTYIISLKSGCIRAAELNLKLDILGITADTYEHLWIEIEKYIPKLKRINPNLKVISTDKMNPMLMSWRTIADKYLDIHDGFCFNFEECCPLYSKLMKDKNSKILQLYNKNNIAFVDAAGTSTIDICLTCARLLNPDNIITIGWDINYKLRYYLGKFIPMENRVIDTDTTYVQNIEKRYLGEFGRNLNYNLNKYYNINIYKYSTISLLDIPIYNLT